MTPDEQQLLLLNDLRRLTDQVTDLYERLDHGKMNVSDAIDHLNRAIAINRNHTRNP